MGCRLLSRSPTGLSGEGLTAFHQLVAEYRILPLPAQLTPVHAYLNAILDRAEQCTLSWDDRYNFERGLLEVIPEGHLRRMAWSLRDSYRGRVTPERYKAYEASSPPDAAAGNVEILRRDLAELLSEMQWLAIQARAVRNLRTRLAANAVALTAVACLGVAAYMVWCWFRGERLYTLPFVLLAGALGGTVSAMRRIERADLRGAPEALATIRGTHTLLWAPLSGVIGALLLYLLFLGGLLVGTLFPAVAPDPPDRPLRTFSHFVWKTGPTHAADYAKVLLWSFVAGFSELLVPDLLDWLGRSAKARASDDAGTTGVGSAGGK